MQRSQRWITMMMVGIAFMADRAAAQTCFREPSPRCSGIILVHAGMGRYLGSLPPFQADKGPAVWNVDLAYLAQAGATDAIGGGVFVGGNTLDAWYGIQGRYRRWLNESVSLDVALGVAGTGRSIPAPMWAGQAGVNFEDRFSVVLQLQTLGDEQWLDERRRGVENPAGDTFLAPSLSVRVGGKWAAIASAAVGGIAGLAWLALS